MLDSMKLFLSLQTQSWSIRRFWIVALGLVAWLLWSPAAIAHHPLDGRLPSNWFEGFMSGVAHPVIGVDHFVFVIAAGFVGALIHRGIAIPVLFVVASLAGTGLHLLYWDLPAPELIIAASVLLFGMVLALGWRSQGVLVALVGAIAGLFHGYAYGEAIVGAELTPLVAYLLGFAVVQLAVSLVAWQLGRMQLEGHAAQGLLNLRFIGFVICGAGAAFVSGVMLG